MHSLHPKQETQRLGKSVPSASADRKSRGRNIPPSLEAVVTARVVTSSGFSSLGLAGPFFLRWLTTGSSLGFPDATQPVPNQLLCSAASLFLRFSTGKSFRLSCPTSRLTRPDTPSSLPDGTSGNMACMLSGLNASTLVVI
jgi:hypothetical protein